jgi:uncharacterized RDD family membrane protein YckC
MATATLIRPEEALDTTVRLVTPERIVFNYPLAGPFRRVVAYLLDLMLLIFLAIVVLIASLAFFGLIGAAGAGTGVFLVAYFLLMWGYGAFCEGVFNGQTVGKRLIGIRVMSDQGVPITGAQAVLRNLVGAVDGPLPFVFMLGLSSMLLTRKFQRLGDLAAGTMVVVEQRRRRVGVIRIKDPAVDAVLPWLPVRIEAGPEMARALSDYVKHRSRFGRSRREEMAAHLARPLRTQYKLPEETSADAILCAAYHRVFLGD